MRLSLFRVWRENRAIERAMRTSPPPKAPEWLRERLVEQAQAAEGESHARLASSRPGLVWAVPAAALALASVWFVLRVPAPQKTPAAAPRVVVHAPLSTVKPEVKTPPKPARHEFVAVRPHVRRVRHRWQRPTMAAIRDIPETPEARTSSLQVSVTRTAEPSASYASVTAYDNDSGAETRTAWVLADDPETGAYQQEMIVNDESGRRQLLRVSVFRSPNQRKGEEL